MTRSRDAIRRYVTQLLAAPLLAAVTLAAAPAAGAASNPVACRESGKTQMCQKQGHSSLRAQPTVRNSSPWLPGYGFGHLPPILALD